MPGATPTYGLPYPVGTDPVADGDNTMQALAQEVEAELARVDAALVAGDTATLAAARTARVVLGAEALGILSGVNTLTATFRNRMRVWRYADNATSILGGTVLIPPGWTTAHVDLWWTNAGAGAGVVAWRCDLGPMVEGAAVPDPATGTGGPTTEVAAPADGIVKRSRVATGAAVTAGAIHALEMMRHGALAGDTLPNEATLIAVDLVRAS